MKSKKTLISKIFICVGIILIIAYAFLPIFHFDSKNLYGEALDVEFSISMSTFFFPGDKAAEMIEINTSTDDWQQVTSVLRGIGFTVYIIPIVMFAAAAVLFSLIKARKLPWGWSYPMRYT